MIFREIELAGVFFEKGIAILESRLGDLDESSCQRRKPVIKHARQRSTLVIATVDRTCILRDQGGYWCQR